MKYLITGINGFLGSYLAAKLERGNDLIGIARESGSSNVVATYSADDLHLIPDVPDVIIMCHAAISAGNYACDTKTLVDSNVLLTEKIASRFPTTRIIYVSSASIFKRTGGTILEGSDIQPNTGYAMSKYWGELVSKGPLSTVVRLSSLYGEGMKENTLIPNYVNAALKTGRIEVWGNGMRRQNYLHVTDAAELIRRIALLPTNENRVYLGVDIQEYSNLEVAQIIASVCNAEIVFKSTDESPSVHFDNSSTRLELGWTPATQIADGLKQYIEWKRGQS